MYKNFNKYILRTPLFPTNYFFNLTKYEDISNEDLIKEFYNPIIKEAIYLASPILYKQLEKWSNKEIKDKKNIKKIRNSFLKYLSRMSSRPTPFGLFGGTCLGRIKEQDSILIDSLNNKRHTRLDMNLTGILIENIEKDTNIKNQLFYYPNTSLYTSGNQLRYLECDFKKGRLTHQIVEVENSEYLNTILISSKNGLNVNDIANSIVSTEISFEIAYEFIHDLIDNQILVSEMQQTVSGKENIDQILNVLNKIDGVDGIIEKIKVLKQKLAGLDLKIGNRIQHYLEIGEILKSFEISFDEKYVFQTDLILKTTQNSINSDINKKLSNSLLLLNKIYFHKENNNLNEFKKVFLERYENKEMPLSLVLDEEIGIGYPITYNNGDVNPLIDDLFFNKQQSTPTKKIEWSSMHSILLKKLMSSIKKDSQVIELYDEEFSGFPVNWADLPDTLSTIAQIVTVNGKKNVIMEAAVGSSAANLLGRFCHGDTDINDFVNEIAHFENKINPDKLLCEIVHLPEDRLGNILLRPSFRNYEIPYLSQSYKNTENQIPIDDILVSIWNNKIVLKSKSKGVEILPRLSTAHNFTKSNLPVYRFLCEMQNSDKRNFLFFDWGSLSDDFSFLPRVVYKDVILSTAKWQIEFEEIKDLTKISDKKELLERVKKWSLNKNISQYIYLVEGDNKLLINLFNTSSLEMFFSTVNKKGKIILEEFLFEDEPIISDINKENFVNEFIFSFYKNFANTN